LRGAKKVLYLHPLWENDERGCGGSGAEKKVLKKLARELEERKKRLPLQPGSEESGED